MSDGLALWYLGLLLVTIKILVAMSVLFSFLGYAEYLLTNSVDMVLHFFGPPRMDGVISSDKSPTMECSFV